MTPRPTPPARVVVLQSNIDDAHQRKYVDWLRRSGVDARAAGFRRSDYYRTPDIAVQCLGEIDNGRYVTRLRTYLRTLASTMKMIRGADLLLVFGGDLALVVALAVSVAPARPVILREVADIPRVLSSRSFAGRTARIVERLALRRTDLLVVTSSAFVAEFYGPALGYVRSWVEVENLPQVKGLEHLVSVPRREMASPVTIGYFGLLRCERALQVLTTLVKQHPETYRLLLSGHNLTSVDLAKLADEVPGVRFAGPYESPRDLATIYSLCDVVFTAYPYDPGNLNSRLARTNRFYEAVIFQRPQITQCGSMDAARVLESEAGVAIDLQSVDGAVDALAAITAADWATMQEGARKLAATLEDGELQMGRMWSTAEALLLRKRPVCLLPSSGPP